MVAEQIDILLLLALPASGKSEVRRYFDHLDVGTARRDMAMGPIAQLDDYPYVHLMRRISQELTRLGENPEFFASDNTGFIDPIDWLTLVHLINEDYLRTISGDRSAQTAATLLDRFDRARDMAGARAFYRTLGRKVGAALESAIATDVADLDPVTVAEDESTIIIEFARGGPVDAGLPLPHPLGYAASIAELSDEIRTRASILYIWVEPIESSNRNRARTVPSSEGDASILHHGVPEIVMTLDYGTDDISWLQSQARSPGTIPIGSCDIPMERFDNRVDHTSFLRADPCMWPVEMVDTLHHDLSAAMLSLAHQ